MSRSAEIRFSKMAMQQQLIEQQQLIHNQQSQQMMYAPYMIPGIQPVLVMPEVVPGNYIPIKLTGKYLY